MRLHVALFVLAACGDNEFGIEPTANLARDIVHTELAIDVTAQTGTAIVTFAPSTQPGASLEIGDLEIRSVIVRGREIDYDTGTTLDLGLPASADPLPVTIEYSYRSHDMADGVSSRGYTLVWPYYCFNIFPCHSDPHDGSAYSIQLSGVPDGKLALYPAQLPDSPAYQVAWVIAALEELSLGVTTAGTEIAMWHPPGEEMRAMRGGVQLVAAFDWLEQTLGPYQFGPKVGGVSVDWNYTDVGTDFTLGGMEHHPFWHIDRPSFPSSESHIHEAVHGWYGDGVRIGCWEDMVVSEGTTTYLAGRVLEVLNPASTYFAGIAGGLAPLPAADSVWPESCGVVDGNAMINVDVYLRGGMFFRALANKLGADVLDGVLAAFYAERMLKSARVDDMLAKIEEMTGYDPMPCAITWLRTVEVPAGASSMSSCP